MTTMEVARLRTHTDNFGIDSSGSNEKIKSQGNPKISSLFKASSGWIFSQFRRTEAKSGAVSTLHTVDSTSYYCWVGGFLTSVGAHAIADVDDDEALLPVRG